MSFIQHYILLHSVLKYSGLFPTVVNLQEVIALIKHYHIKAEIIGKWLYCFTTPLIGVQLEAIGFWYSFKHGAYIFSGSPKQSPADDESLDEIRSRLGSRAVTLSA